MASPSFATVSGARTGQSEIFFDSEHSPLLHGVARAYNMCKSGAIIFSLLFIPDLPFLEGIPRGHAVRSKPHSFDEPRGEELLAMAMAAAHGPDIIAFATALYALCLALGYPGQIGAEARAWLKRKGVRANGHTDNRIQPLAKRCKLGGIADLEMTPEESTMVKRASRLAWSALEEGKTPTTIESGKTWTHIEDDYVQKRRRDQGRRKNRRRRGGNTADAQE